MRDRKLPRPIDHGARPSVGIEACAQESRRPRVASRLLPRFDNQAAPGSMRDGQGCVRASRCGLRRCRLRRAQPADHSRFTQTIGSLGVPTNVFVTRRPAVDRRSTLRAAKRCSPPLRRLRDESTACGRFRRPQWRTAVAPVGIERDRQTWCSLNDPGLRICRSSVGTGGSVAGRRLVAQGRVAAVVVVVVFPVADDHAGLG